MSGYESQDGQAEAVQRIEEARKNRSKELKLNGLGLKSIPDLVALVPWLQQLDLSSNQIGTLPSWLAGLNDLWLLNLKSNALSTIPDPIAELSCLTILDLSSNQIAAVPDWLPQLPKLKWLYLADNQIEVIPHSIADLRNLRILNLNRNRISTIPDFLGEVAELEGLWLANNQISAIPDSLAQVTKLKELDLSRNQIGAIPESLSKLDQLTLLFLHGNSQLDIPEEVLGPPFSEVFGKSKKPAKAAKEILNYYFAQFPASRPLNEAKLILVGRGGVGKTSLVKSLTSGVFEPGEPTTEGIKISDWRCPLPDNQKVTLHIWDFGGQEMMHATHQFFLTARTLYVLVLTRRQGGNDEEADYWFRLIHAFGGKDAPVIVVLNKQKTEPFDVNRGAWLEKYADNIRAFVTTACEDGGSIAALTETIRAQLDSLSSVKSKFPTRWFAIKDELARMPADFVTFDSYRSICLKHGENDPQQQQSLSGFLHDLGIALNYKDDPRLRFAYVLKPEWVTTGIYALLHAFVEQKGVFTAAKATSVLAPKGYAAEAVDFLLGLMEQFELSFPLADSEKRNLIPQLLADAQPPEAGSFRPAECLNFGYRYSILPEGLLPRFIVRTHHLSDPALRWKSGVILQDAASGCRALVKGESVDRQVRIHVDGPEASRSELLAIVRYNFEVIHSDYKFAPEGLVYPPGVPDKPLSVDDLEALQRAGQLTTPVVLPDRKVITPNIATLIQPAETTTPALRVFLSYSHMDADHIEELRKDLKVMERNGLVRVWYDRALKAGDKWESAILHELEEADAIVCQLSRDFLASDFCVLTELATAIRRKEAGEAELIAYVLRDCAWRDVANLRQFQILPEGAKPAHRWRSKDAYWNTVATGIKDALKEFAARRPQRFADRERLRRP